jgi:hypothetical protein
VWKKLFVISSLENIEPFTQSERILSTCGSGKWLVTVCELIKR